MRYGPVILAKDPRIGKVPKRRAKQVKNRENYPTRFLVTATLALQ